MQRQVRWGFGFALLCLLASGASAYLCVLNLDGNGARIERNYQVLSSLDQLQAAVSEVQIGGRRYVTARHPENLDRYLHGLSAIEHGAPQARRLVAQDTPQSQRLQVIEQLVGRYIATLSSAISVAQRDGVEAAQRLDPSPGRQLYDEFLRRVVEMKEAENTSLLAHQRQRHTATESAELVILGGGLFSIILAGVGLRAIRKQFSARARAEAALRLAKQELESRVEERGRALKGIIETSDDAIITKTLDGVITSWNPGAERIFGYAAADAIGRSIQLIIPPERAEEEPAILARLRRGERVDHFETVRLRADGSPLDVSVTISPLFDGAGRIIGASKIARDITERRIQERKVRAQLERLHLLEHITRAISERQDLKSIYQVVTRSLEEQMPVDFACVVPYESASETLRLPALNPSNEVLARKLADSQDRLIHLPRFGELIYEPDIAGSTLELPAFLAEGGLHSLVMVPLLVSYQPFALLIAARFKTGSFTSTDCEFLRQLSEHLALASHQAELHGSLQAAYDDLRQTQLAVMQQERLRALGQMASGVAHDINNALAPPALYIQILLQHEKSLSAEARGYLQITERALEDVSHTIDRLRLFYAAREDERKLAAVDLNQLLDQIADISRARWSTMPQRHGAVIELKRELASSVAAIEGDESEIRDGLTNLVFNAVDAMPQGGTLTLRSRGVQSGDHTSEHVVVEVSDTGLGMSDAVRARCLEPFFTTKGQRGSGLGLAMVYGMAQRHGADLEIDSEPGVGTTVRLTFRASSLTKTSPAPPVLPPPARRILIVDDDPLVLKAMRAALESDGHVVTAVDSGRAGIEEFRAAQAGPAPYTVVFTDLGMPNLDGRLVAKAIKELAPEVPIVLLTGWGQRLGEASEKPRHIDRILSKPPKLQELRSALTELAWASGA